MAARIQRGSWQLCDGIISILDFGAMFSEDSVKPLPRPSKNWTTFSKQDFCSAELQLLSKCLDEKAMSQGRKGDLVEWDKKWMRKKLFVQGKKSI